MYKPSDLTGPKEINHDVMFREGQNLEVSMSLNYSSGLNNKRPDILFAWFQRAKFTTSQNIIRWLFICREKLLTRQGLWH